MTAARARPWMWVQEGAAQYSLVVLAVEAALDTLPTTVTVTLLPDGAVRVADDGGGIHVARRPVDERPWVEEVLTVPFCGVRSPEAPGLGLFTVNAFCTAVDVEIARDGHRWTVACAGQRVVTPLTRAEPAARTGTAVTFRPDPAVLPDVSFDPGTLAEHLRAVEAEHGVRVVLADERGATGA